MNRCAGMVVLVPLLVLGACSAPAESDADATETETETVTVTETVMPSPDVESEATGLPTRAEMDAATRILAEAFYLEALAADEGLAAITDEDLVAAGDAVCDAMDRGDSFQSVLIVGASVVPEATSSDSIAVLTGAAAGVLCPEHADYVD